MTSAKRESCVAERNKVSLQSALCIYFFKKSHSRLAVEKSPDETPSEISWCTEEGKPDAG